MKRTLLWSLGIIGLINYTTTSAAEESAKQQKLDLNTYTCAQFIEHVEKQNQIAMIATVWASGYRIGVLGLDEMPLLDPTVIETDIYGLKTLCTDYPKATFVKTLQDVLQKQLEEKKN